MLALTFLLWAGLLLVHGEQGNVPGEQDCTEPTPSELSHAVMHSAPEDWAETIREQKSIRVLCLGGSNTYPQDKPKYPEMLDTLLKEKISHSSYALNEGKPGVGPNENIGMTYTWEQWPHHRWPNVITLEFTINAKLGQTLLLTRLIESLEQKYIQAKVSYRPAILFVDLFAFQPWERKLRDGAGDSLQSETMENRMEMLTELFNNKELRPLSFDVSAEFYAYSRFFQYPVVSTFDSLFPSFKRWFLETSGVERYKKNWKYTDDYTHLSRDGHILLVQEILVPFLVDELRKLPSRTSAYNTCASVSYLHPHSKAIDSSSINIVLTSWHPTTNTLKKSVSPSSSDYDFIQTLYHSDHTHRCFGSFKRNSSADFFVNAPKECTEAKPCYLDIWYLSSWNKSYTGDTECSLYKTSSLSGDDIQPGVVAGSQVGSSIKVYGDGRNGVDGSTVKGTGPTSTSMSNAPLVSGGHVLRCIKDDTPRLSCFAGLKISNIL